MRKIILFLILLVSMTGLFAQQATINGLPGTSETSICDGTTMTLTAGITTGTIATVRWYEQVDSGPMTLIGTGTSVTTPSTSAQFGHVYHYQVKVTRVEDSPTAYWAYLNVTVNAPPTAYAVIANGVNGKIGNYCPITETGTTFGSTGSQLGFQYQLQLDNAPNTTFESLIGTGGSIFFSPVQAGNYRILITDPVHGCQTVIR